MIRSDRRARKLRAYCEKVHLHFQFWNAYGKRGSSYRKAFFDAHAPIFGDYYFCAYCGRLVRSDKVSVDHLYPVGRAGKSVTMQKLLKKKHFSGVNDPRNLVASCKSCNQKKGKKMEMRKKRKNRRKKRKRKKRKKKMVLFNLIWMIFLMVKKNKKKKKMIRMKNL